MILLFALFGLRVPTAIALLVATAFYFGFVNTFMPKEAMIQTMVASMESFPYLAIPFFTCAGVVFNYAGITSRLMGLAEMLFGHMRGAMAQVNVALSALMGGLPGSASADAAMQTKMVVPQMVGLGYDRAFSTAVTAASACITAIIPPGIILILYALVADVSVAKMFLAGYLPGLMICVALMAAVALISKKRGYAPSRRKRASGHEILRQLGNSIWALMLPFGIIMGLRFGVFTPTEAGAIAVVYALFVGGVVYRELRLKDIPAIIEESVLATAGVMFFICAANAFATYLTWDPLGLLELPAWIGAVAACILADRQPHPADHRLFLRGRIGHHPDDAATAAGRHATRHRPGAFRHHHVGQPDDRGLYPTGGHDDVHHHLDRESEDRGLHPPGLALLHCPDCRACNHHLRSGRGDVAA